MTKMQKTENFAFRLVHAAKVLGVTLRTLQLWLKDPEKRDLLGAFRAGKRWRLRRPESLPAWAHKVRQALALPERWKKELYSTAKEDSAVFFEAIRLWLAIRLMALKLDAPHRESVDAALLIWQACCQALSGLPRYEMDAFKCRANIERILSKRTDLPCPVGHIMAFWPDDAIQKQIRNATTMDELERLRRAVDYAEALRRHQEQGVSGKDLAPLLHRGFIDHINDTGECFTMPSIRWDDLRKDLGLDRKPADPRQPPCTPAQQIRALCEFFGGGRIIDFRESQDGISLRTFRSRYPKRTAKQKRITASLSGVLDFIPSSQKSADDQAGDFYNEVDR